jgi:DNA-binding response OmpR family regulator
MTLTTTGVTSGLLVDERDRPVALVIDDDADTRERIADALRAQGWLLRQARDAERGLLMAREHVPEVILLDLALPRMSGLDVLREVKSARWLDQPTRIVVVSFFAMLLRLPDLRLADAVVQKPFATADLLAQVAVALSSRPVAY